MTGREFWPFVAARTRYAEERMEWDLRMTALQASASGMSGEAPAALYAAWTGRDWQTGEPVEESDTTQGGMQRRLMQRALEAKADQSPG